MAKTPQQIANEAVKNAGGRRILTRKDTFSAVKAVKKEEKETGGKKR